MKRKSHIQAEVNVTVELLLGNKVIDRRLGHNVLVDNGRTWLRNLVAAAGYGSVDPANGFIEGSGNVVTSERVRFIGFGVGGVLSTEPYYRVQEETTDVTSLEDYVNVEDGVYLKELDPQSIGAGSFPDAFTLRLTTDLAESEISFAGNTSRSGNVVGTNVPVSEVGLFLSGANPDESPEHADNVGKMVAYHIFSPVPVTPNTVLRITWELLF